MLFLKFTLVALITQFLKSDYILYTSPLHLLVFRQSFYLENNPLLEEFLSRVLDGLSLKSCGVLPGAAYSTFALSAGTSLGQLVEARGDVLLVELHLLLVELSLAVQFVESLLQSAQLLLALLSIAMLIANVLQETRDTPVPIVVIIGSGIVIK